ncbi:hypothetical protein [Pseudonocardia sp.]|uniref:hypothetical protein n=1 Tax=Pseudonocardia sp. TaxID=60912 RepID=UPI0026219C3A|nr:hypothetical protein [Pseudonocardia sp.]
MTDRSPTGPDDRPPAAPHPLAESEERCARAAVADDGEVSPRPGHRGSPRAGSRTHARTIPPGPTDDSVEAAAVGYRCGAADDALRRVLARLRRHRDPEVRAAADTLAADAAAALLAIAERGEQHAPTRGGVRYRPPNDIAVGLVQARDVFRRSGGVP